MTPAIFSPRCGTPARSLRNRALAAICWSLAAGLPAAVIWSLAAKPLAALLRDGSTDVPAAHALSAMQLTSWQHVVVFSSALLPVSCVAYGLWSAGRCFMRFAHGEYFTLTVVGNLRAFAAGVFAAAVTGSIAPILVGVVLSIGGAADAPAVRFELNSHQLLLLLFSVIVWQVAAAMAKAAAMAQEHSQFV